MEPAQESPSFRSVGAFLICIAAVGAGAAWTVEAGLHAYCMLIVQIVSLIAAVTLFHRLQGKLDLRRNFK